MKSIRSLLTLALLSPIFGAEPVPPVQPTEANLPAEITRFYRDVNFATCFSTPDERKLVSHWRATNSGSNHLQGRLHAVARSIGRIRSSLSSIDPTMVVWHGPDLATAEIMEILSRARDGNVIRVEVALHSVSRETNQWLVAQYGKAETQPASSTSMLEGMLKQTVRKETHTWSLQNGRWTNKTPAVLLNSKQ